MADNDPSSDDLVTLYPIDDDVWRFDGIAFMLGFGLCALAGALSGLAWWGYST